MIEVHIISNACATAPALRYFAARASSSSREFAARVRNESSIRSRGARVTRQRKLKIGSTTVPEELLRFRRTSWRRVAASQKCLPHRPILTHPRTEQVCRPYGSVVRPPQAAVRDQQSIVNALRLDEHFGKRRVSRIGTMRRQG